MTNTQNWKAILRTDPTDWLLEKDNLSIRYWTLKDLLDKREREPEVAEARGKISESEEVRMVFSKIDINGGPFWSRSNGDIYWGAFSTGSVLCFLAETGLTKEWLFRTQRLDGGWCCTKKALRGGSKEKLDSCPHSVLNILWAFMNTPELRKRKELIPALEFLLRHWETKKPIPDVDRGRYGIGSRFKWIRYPLFEYHPLKYVYILSHYDYALKDKRLSEAVDLLMSKQDSQGHWAIDKPYRGWEEFEFGRKGSPSKWVTLNALREC
jgi:hypothetical protein